MDTLELTRASAPEIGMTIVAIVALLLDVTLMRAWTTARRAQWLGAITALGLAGVLALVCWHCFAMGASQWADPARTIVIDQLGLGLKALVLVLAISTVLLSVDYEFTQHVGEYFAVTVMAAIGMSFLVVTENLLMVLVAIELLSVSLYILTAFHKGLLRSAEAAAKYFIFGALSSAFLLFGLSYVVGTTGAVTVSDVATASAAHGGHSPLLLVVGLVFMIVGLGFKVAVVPFHAWAPDAYEGAPTPVSAFIATGSKAASFVITAKIVLVGFAGLAGSAHWSFIEGPQAGWSFLLALLGAASMLWGNVAAIAQRNVKRMLAYSSIAHAGYILIGVIAATEMGVTSVLYYLVAYALANLGAFGVVTALTPAAGGDDFEDFDGMAQRAPLLSLLLLIFVLSLAGIPPLAGFFGKFFLFAAAVQSDPKALGLLWLVIIGVATSVVSLYYYLVLLKCVFVLAPRDERPIKSSLLARFTLAVLALTVVGLGACPQPLVQRIEELLPRTIFLAPAR